MCRNTPKSASWTLRKGDLFYSKQKDGQANQSGYPSISVWLLRRENGKPFTLPNDHALAKFINNTLTSPTIFVWFSYLRVVKTCSLQMNVFNSLSNLFMFDSDEWTCYTNFCCTFRLKCDELNSWEKRVDVHLGLEQFRKENFHYTDCS